MSEITWDGKGLPPIGFFGIAEFQRSIGDRCDLDRFIGKQVTVIGHFETKDGKNGIVIEHKTHGVGALMYYEEGIIKPIKSERDKAIEEMQKIMSEMDYLLSPHVFAAFYDAGYRKVETK